MSRETTNDTGLGGATSDPNASAFQDSSVQRAVGSGGTQWPTTGLSLDEFSPFTQTRTKGHSDVSANSTSEPATLSPLEAPPAYTASTAQRISTDELEKRARELAEKEAQLVAREAALDKMARQGGHMKNWPPLPDWFPVGPCFYQDIQVEIPSRFQGVVRRGYILWVLHTGGLLLNFIGAICYFAAMSSRPESASNAGTTLGCSILFIVMFAPCSYVCWFRPLYKAFRSDSSLHFFSFFLIFMVQFIVSVINAIGFVGYGAVGWINSLATIGTSLGVGVFMLICASMFTALATLDFIFLVSVHRLYRTTGASFEQARSELAASVLTSQAAQAAVVQAATAGVSSAPPGSRRF